MTKPEDIAEWAWNQAGDWISGDPTRMSAAAIQEIIARAIIDEREQCAKEADKWNRRDVAAEIAFAIRNRKES